MKKVLFTALIAITSFAAQAQVAQKRKVSDFSKIYVRDGIEVVLTQGDKESVRVVAGSEEDFKYVVTKSDGNTLKIFLSEDEGKDQHDIKVYITQKELTALKAGTGASILVSGEIKTSGFALDMAAGASFTGKINSQGAVRLSTRSGSNFNGVITANLLNGDFKDGSVVKLAGFSKTATIFSNSGAVCMASAFICDRAYVNATDHSTVIIDVKESIVASADETATITYYGNPPKTRLDNSYVLAKK